MYYVSMEVTTSMNVNQVSKLFSDMNTQEVKTLELRVGQVVRGVVTQQLPNQEALVNINGVQIKAKLEVPILEGQATLMQVASDSKGSFIHLKQVDATSVGLQDPMKDIIKAMNLPDKEWSNQLVRELRQEGFPLNKETIQTLAQAARLAPANVDLESWMQAATLAFKRGVPMTFASISAMQQLSQGQPLHQLITQLQQQLAQLVQTAAPQLSTQSAQVLQQLTHSLNQILLTQNFSQSQGSQLTQQAQQQSTNTQIAQNNSQASSQNINQLPTNNQTTAQVNLQAQAMNQSQLVNATQNPIASLMKLLGVQHENQLGQQIIQRGEVVASATQSNIMQSSQQTQNNTVANPILQAQQSMTVQGQGLVNANAAQLQGQTTQSQPLQAIANQTTQTITGQLGTSQAGQGQNIVTHGQSIQASPINQAPVPSHSSTVMSQQQTTAIVGNGEQATLAVQAEKQQISQQLLGKQHVDINLQPQTGATSQTSDSIKATVMQALQLNDVPATLKEPLNHLLNHITGQQLMLSTERNQSMFTHITMYVPIKDDQGGQTAAIHVQTRRDRKGQLDAENCRIVFDLNMKQIGQTLVDLNVVNKIVSINIWNDASYIQPLIDSMRPEIVESMQKTGYSLSSIKTTPFKHEEQQELEEVKAIVQPPDVQHMNASRYKGVDLKV